MRWLDRLSEGRFGLVVTAPGLLLVGAFVLPPILAAIGMSFFRIELLRDDFTPFIGFRNYAVRLAADSDFLGTLPLTVGFAVVTSALTVPIALATAVLIDGRGRFAAALAVVLLLPWAIAPIADGILWRLMFEPRTGLVTYVLSQLGLPTVVIRDAAGAIVAMIVAVTWRAIPLLAIIFLAALRRVPAEARRAARLDGASNLQSFRYITLPAIAPVVVAACLIQVILSLQVFEVQYALSSGAPPKGSMLAGLAIFNTVIGDISLGYGSAMTMVVGLFIALCLGGSVPRDRAAAAETPRPQRGRRSTRRPGHPQGIDGLVQAAWRSIARAGGSPTPAMGDAVANTRPQAPRLHRGCPVRHRGRTPRAVARRSDRLDRHREHATDIGSRRDASAADREPRPVGVWRPDLRPRVARRGGGQHHRDCRGDSHRSPGRDPCRLSPGPLSAAGGQDPAAGPARDDADPADRPRDPDPLSRHRPWDPRQHRRPRPGQRRVLVTDPHLAGARRVHRRAAGAGASSTHRRLARGSARSSGSAFRPLPR